MGRMIQKEVVGIRCDVARCGRSFKVAPQPATSTDWSAHWVELNKATKTGWVFVLHAWLRAFCVEHRDRAWDCTCRRHPERAHLCTSHDREASRRVWSMEITPAVVKEFEPEGVAA